MRPPSVTPKELPMDEIEKKTKSLMDEYLAINDVKVRLNEVVFFINIH